MAEMFPDSLVGYPNVTEGEKRMFNILRDVLPDEEYICWYEPKIESRTGRFIRPDFIIWGQLCGLIILEIKDWVLSNISGGDNNNINFICKGEIIVKPNPERQVKEYMNNLMSNLEKIKEFVNLDGRYKGRLKFPCGYGLVFSKLSHNNFNSLNLGEIINTKNIFTLDDLDKISDGNKIILTDKFGRINNLFPFEPLSKYELDKLRLKLHPIIKIPEIIKTVELEVKENILVSEKEEANYGSFNVELVKVLDKKQEMIAFKMGPGHRIIKGAAGSGKTLLLAYKAKILKTFYPNYRVLFLCYNITLRKYIESLIDNIYKESSITHEDIEIYHFHDFIKSEYNIDIRYSQNDDWIPYQNRLGEELMNKINKGSIKGEVYDAILIDECQDLTSDYIKFLVHILNKKSNHLLIAIDPAQNIYGGKITWKSVGVDAKGRVLNLDISYRNTKKILNFALKFNSQEIEKLYNNDSKLPLFPDKVERDGIKPIVKGFTSEKEISKYISKEIKEIISKQKLNYCDFGIISPNELTYKSILREEL